MTISRILILFLIVLGFAACQQDSSTPSSSSTLFETIPSSVSGIDFINEVENQQDFNIFSYRNFYNGGGVAIGDINNDGLSDIYFTKNMGSNKLYLNQGNFKFKDITENSSTAGTKTWSTGVVMVDINADGWLDIYVCNAGYNKEGHQENELFINNQDGTFTESAADYGLNENGYTTHAAFFDYDMDGDLDCYILNNSFIPVNTLNYSNKRALNAKDWPVKEFLKGGGDKLLRNDNGNFKDVSEEAGIFGSLIGFGLGVTVGDVNGDHYPDLYISNDFFERDYLYINQKNGTFSEEIKDWTSHLSLASMGTDMGDINNDGYPEIFATEMLPESDYRRKTTSLFQNYNVYSLFQERDFYHQYMHNTLQLNNKNGTFSDIAWYSGVAATDWSWGALFLDADLDGYQDIFVCNGIYHDVTDQDFMDFFANDVIQKMVLTGEKEEINTIIDKMPSHPIPNKFFRNLGNLKFEDKGENYGLAAPAFSNGAAYGDLDNDGDLDLIVNNLESEAFVYRNNQEKIHDHHYLQVALEGPESNPFAVGAKILTYQGESIHSFQMVPSRGFQSSIDYIATFGFGKQAKVDSLIVIWPDRSQSVIKDCPIDQKITVKYNETPRVTKASQTANTSDPLLEEAPINLPKHQENNFVDFYQEGLTMRMLSREGPKAAKGDLNNDGKADLIIGGAENQPDQLFFQTENGLEAVSPNPFGQDAIAETTAITLFDMDQDGDLDVYMGNGGNNMTTAGQAIFQDRLYRNDGAGNFSPMHRNLPPNGLNTAVIIPLDIDEDGDLDLFVGSRSLPQNYGVPARNFIFINDGTGKFSKISKDKAPAIETLGMVTDAKLADFDQDGKNELLVVGEWMAPRLFDIQDGGLKETETNLNDYSGWWYSIESADLDGDGDLDLILGNRGENFYFSGTKEAPAKLWINDFDQNKTIEKLITQTIDGKDMPVPMKKELTEQVVSLKKQNLKHTEYATKSIQELFSKEVLDKGLVWEANYFKSVVAINQGNGQFDIQALPTEVQLSCVCDIYCEDLNDDGKLDLLLAGNFDGFTPQFSKLDASFGHTLINQGQGNFELIESAASGFFVRGEVKQILEVELQGNPHILVLVNNGSPKLFRKN